MVDQNGMVKRTLWDKEVVSIQFQLMEQEIINIS